MLANRNFAPNFELEDLAGKKWSLAEALKRGPVLLAFFKISCPTCQLTFPFLQRLADGGGKEAPQLVAVSQDDAADTAQFNKRFNLSMRTVLDPPRTYPASNAFGISHVPSLFLIEPDGRIHISGSGFGKFHLEELGARFGVSPFRPEDRVPVLQPG
ncbi:MAG: TlpA disulfide reductase family protein [Bryobacteraceae bacterium]